MQIQLFSSQVLKELIVRSIFSSLVLKELMNCTIHCPVCHDDHSSLCHVNMYFE